MSVMGRHVPQFSRAVCSAFQETVVDGEVCYQLDVNTYADSLDWRQSMQFGLGFLVDTNEELDSKRLYSNFDQIDDEYADNKTSLRSYVKFEDSSKVKIYLHTLGKGSCNCF